MFEFGIVTNGLIFNNDIVDIIKQYSKLVTLCREIGCNYDLMPKYMNVTVGVSLDKFHSNREVVENNFEKADIENRIVQLQAEIQELSPPDEITEEDIDYEKKIQILQYALKQYTDGDLDEDIPESVIEAFVIKIVASKDSFDWYLRFSPDTPHKCRVEGSKRKPELVNINSPSLVESSTSCHQEQVNRI